MAQCESSYKRSSNPMIIMGAITGPVSPEKTLSGFPAITKKSVSSYSEELLSRPTFGLGILLRQRNMLYKTGKADGSQF